MSVTCAPLCAAVLKIRSATAPRAVINFSTCFLPPSRRVPFSLFSPQRKYHAKRKRSGSGERERILTRTGRRRYLNNRGSQSCLLSIYAYACYHVSRGLIQPKNLTLYPPMMIDPRDRKLATATSRRE